MAKAFSLELQGFDKLQKKFNQLPQKLQKEIDAEIGFSAENIRSKQLRLVPVDEGQIKQGLPPAKRVKVLEWELTATKHYSAYQEFGTKSKAVIPSELSEFASQFRGGGGSFEELFKSIVGWVKRHGMEEKAAYPIARSIAIKGIPPHPFFFPPFFAERKNLIKNIQNVLTQEL